MSYRLLSTRRLRPAAAILALLALATPPARAQTNYYWNPPVGGGGVWDISTRNWSTVATGPDDYVWTNSGNEVANFGNQPGGVFLNAPITAGGINFTTNYVLFNNVAANSLTLAGGGVIDTGSNTDTVNVVIAGAAGLTKNGTGTLVLSGTSTYTGAVAVNVGVLSITNASGLGAAANTVTVANGAALQVNGGVTVAQPITLTGNGVANGGALRNIFDGNTLSGAITIAAGGARINSDVLGTQGAPTLTVSTGGINGAAANTPLTFGGAGNVTVSGAIGGNIGTITKDGAGTLTLSGTNAYTGATTISGGALAVNSSGALGATTGVTVAAGAAVQLGGTTTTAAAPLTLNGFGSTTSAGGVSTGGALRGTATGIWSGAITLASAARINSDSGTLSLTGGIDAAAAGTPLTIGGGGGTAIGGPGISSNVGPLIKDGPGLLTLSVANAYTGGTTVSGSGVVGNAQPSGSPFGSATGAITLNEASLGLFGIATTTTTTVGDLIIGAPSGTSSGGAGLVINNTAGQPSAATTTLAAGNLVRGGPGSVLIIAPTTGSLGTGEVLTFTGGTTLTNGILPPWVTAQVSATNPALDFVTYGASGVATATYTSTDVTTSTSASIVNQSTPVTLAGPAAAYALKTNAAITLGGNTLTLGSGTGPAGLILNTGASITGGTVTFGSREGVVYFQGTATLGAAGDTITSNGLAVTAVAASTLTLGGNITGSGPLLLTGTTSGTGVTISGNNTYTGGTVLSVNTGTAANIVLGSDTAFGTGKVTNILAPGSASPQIQATAPRTLANAFDLNGGLTFTGSNNITFTGPVTIIQPQAGGTRTLNDGTGTTATVTFGATPNSSTITLGNPVANGGDGVGKTLVFAPAATSTFVINDVMQDPAAGGGAAGGSVSYAGAAGGITVINSKSTYTGPTNLNGSSIIRFSTDYNPAAGDTSGPFGVGTLNPNQATNNRLQPIGGGTRIIGNPMQLSTGFIVENSGTDTTSVTFSGPISMTNGRTINNNFTATGGTLTLGLATSPSTLTLSPIPNQTLLFTNTGNTVINDAIREVPGSGIATAITISGAGNMTLNGVISSAGLITVNTTGGTNAAPSPTIAFNAMNTYTGGTAFTGPGTLVPVVNSSNALPGPSFTAGPFGTGPIIVNAGTNQHFRPTGGDRVISNAILFTTGIAMDNNNGETFSLTLAGPITMTNNRFISNGFTAGQQGGAFIIGSAAAPNVLTLPTTSNFTLSFAALNGPIIVNDVMQNATGQSDIVSINPNGNNIWAVVLNGANTYSGGTTIGANNANSGGIVQIGVNSVGNPGAITSGPFGTGTVTMNVTNTTGPPPNLQPVGADRTVANAMTLTSGFFATTAPATATLPNLPDPTGPHNLTLTGPITLGTTSRVVTNNMVAGVALTLGAAGASPAQPLTLNSQLVIQSQPGVAGANGGVTVINDTIVDGASAGSLLVQGGGTVNLTNANTYTGGTSVTGGVLRVNNTTGSGTGTGAVAVTGAGTVGTGGTLGGTGTISGTVTISSTTAASQGGTVSPGNSAGTLNVANMVWNPLGQYTFEHDTANSAAGGGVNDLINGTGTLDLTGLAAGTFNLNLVPLTFAPTPTPQTYTLATFGGGITLPAGQDPSNLNNLFTYSGSFTTQPQAFVTGNLLQVSFTPVPEPAFVLAACGGLAGLAGWYRRRRTAGRRPEPAADADSPDRD